MRITRSSYGSRFIILPRVKNSFQRIFLISLKLIYRLYSNKSWQVATGNAKVRHFLVIFNQLVHFFQFCLSHFWRMLFVVHHDFHIIYFRLCRVCCIYIFLISHELVFCNKSRRNEKKNHGNFWHSTIRLIFSSNCNRILNYHSFRTHWKCDGTRGVFARKFLGSMVATSLITIKEGFAPRNAITMPFYSAAMMMIGLVVF